MKVILLKDVPKVGRTGEIKEVADGFALNLLLPQKKAERATPEKIALLKKAQDKKVSEEQEKIKTQFEALKKIDSLVITMKATTEGALFEAVTPAKIAAALRERGLALPESAFAVHQPIKKVGSYSVPVTVGKQQWSLAITVKA
ncbi:MAG: ribosomal protein [Candidatus Parcubacteria bacterium]|jgi:large subunit ribosomal protein L9